MKEDITKLIFETKCLNRPREKAYINLEGPGRGLTCSVCGGAVRLQWGEAMPLRCENCGRIFQGLCYEDEKIEFDNKGKKKDDYGTGFVDGASAMRNHLINAEGYEPVKHGHWIRTHFDSPVWECSVCRANYNRASMIGANWCEACGAKMDEEVKK